MVVRVYVWAPFVCHFEVRFELPPPCAHPNTCINADVAATSNIAAVAASSQAEHGSPHYQDGLADKTVAAIPRVAAGDLSPARCGKRASLPLCSVANCHVLHTLYTCVNAHITVQLYRAACNTTMHAIPMRIVTIRVTMLMIVSTVDARTHTPPSPTTT